jgi:hypothetical protein
LLPPSPPLSLPLLLLSPENGTVFLLSPLYSPPGERNGERNGLPWSCHLGHRCLCCCRIAFAGELGCLRPIHHLPWSCLCHRQLGCGLFICSEEQSSHGYRVGHGVLACQSISFDEGYASEHCSIVNVKIIKLGKLGVCWCWMEFGSYVYV